jgi:hypothetical protein
MLAILLLEPVTKRLENVLTMELWPLDPLSVLLTFLALLTSVVSPPLDSLVLSSKSTLLMMTIVVLILVDMSCGPSSLELLPMVLVKIDGSSKRSMELLLDSSLNSLMDMDDWKVSLLVRTSPTTCGS